MNKRLSLTNLGGLPVTQETFAWIQDNVGSLISAMAALIGDKVIISGVEVSGGNVTSGFICYNGDILPFVGGVAGADVIIQETATPAVFEDNSSHDVYFDKVAKIGSPGAFAFSEFKRLDKLIDILTALNDLRDEFDAHTHPWSAITGKPAADIIAGPLSNNIGDITSTDTSFTFTHNLGIVGDYMVFATIVANDNDYNKNDDFSFVVYDKQPNSFKIGFREYATNTQNLRLEYIIVKAN
jgi:hypothetical protein